MVGVRLQVRQLGRVNIPNSLGMGPFRRFLVPRKVFQKNSSSVNCVSLPSPLGMVPVRPRPERSSLVHCCGSPVQRRLTSDSADIPPVPTPRSAPRCPLGALPVDGILSWSGTGLVTGHRLLSQQLILTTRHNIMYEIPVAR